MRLALVFMALAGSVTADDIIAFTRPGCGPCEAFKADHAKDPGIAAPHRLHLMDARSELAKSYGVTSVPVFIRLKEGRETARKLGYAGKADLRLWLGK